MLLSVVIPVLNAASTLPKCLDSLAAQDFLDAEFVLVDNGSSDGSIELIRQFMKQRPKLNLRLIEEVHPGASAARNRGASQTVGDWLVFTDSDCVADSDWLADLADAIRAYSDVAAFAGTVTAFPAKSCVGTGLTDPPSIRKRPATCAGSKTPITLMLARTASAIGP